MSNDSGSAGITPASEESLGVRCMIITPVLHVMAVGSIDPSATLRPLHSDPYPESHPQVWMGQAAGQAPASGRHSPGH